MMDLENSVNTGPGVHLYKVIHIINLFQRTNNILSFLVA